MLLDLSDPEHPRPGKTELFLARISGLRPAALSPVTTFCVKNVLFPDHFELNRGMAKGRRNRTGIRPKTISAQGITGQQGVNFIEKILLKMGSRWTPSGANEVGIDGYIELFEPASRVSLGLTLAVQSKVVSSIRDAAEEFRYSCDSSDLEYWLKGNIPVILIVSDPETEQGYWVWIQEVFKEWRPGQSPSVLFQKSRDRFHSDSLTDLVRVGAPLRGLYLPPRPKSERLWSNLLRVDALPQVLFVAETSLRSRAEVWAALKKRKARVESGWILWEKKILSFEDLSTRVWEDICEPATVEGFEVLAEGRLFRNDRREQKAVLSIAEAFKRPYGRVPIQQQEQRWKNLRLSETSRVSRSVSLLRRGVVLGSHAYVSLHSRRGATGSFPRIPTKEDQRN
jgi:hypothetical protein